MTLEKLKRQQAAKKTMDRRQKDLPKEATKEHPAKADNPTQPLRTPLPEIEAAPRA